MHIKKYEKIAKNVLKNVIRIDIFKHEFNLNYLKIRLLSA
jgi:hypothetical protein